MLLQEYTSIWAENFEKIKKILNAEIFDYTLGIQHIGSTAIPDLMAKSIIDIDIVYKENDDFENIKKGLERLGYYYNGNQGIVGRGVFKRNGKTKNEILDSITHHLYVCKADSLELQRHILFRDYLQKNEICRKHYQALKLEIAHEAKNDKAVYASIKELKASPFINHIIELAKREF